MSGIWRAPLKKRCIMQHIIWHDTIKSSRYRGHALLQHEHKCVILFKNIRRWSKMTINYKWARIDSCSLACPVLNYRIRAATSAKAAKVWSLPRFWVSISSYKKQPVKKLWCRILDPAWLKFAVAVLRINGSLCFCFVNSQACFW